MSGQSPQKPEPPVLMSSRSSVAVGPRHTSARLTTRVSPRTRLAYGSEQPHDTRPSQSRMAVDHGQEQVKREAW